MPSLVVGSILVILFINIWMVVLSYQLLSMFKNLTSSISQLEYLLYTVFDGKPQQKNCWLTCSSGGVGLSYIQHEKTV